MVYYREGEKEGKLVRGEARVHLKGNKKGGETKLGGLENVKRSEEKTMSTQPVNGCQNQPSNEKKGSGHIATESESEMKAITAARLRQAVRQEKAMTKEDDGR